MYSLGKTDVKELAGKQSGPCISMYTPTPRAGQEAGGNPIRLKNLITEAAEMLAQGGMRRREVDKLLEPAVKLQGDAELWKDICDGLAVFLSADQFRFYKLPLQFERLITVAPRFHLRPLLSLLASDGQFYVLAFSQDQTRLLQCTRYGVKEREVPGMPASISEVLQYDVYEKSLQMHSGARAGAVRSSGIVHGHGGAQEHDLSDAVRYCQSVDKAVRSILNGEGAPLVLAAVDSLRGIYRQASTYANLLDRGLEGNPELVNNRDLRERAWGIVYPVFEKAEQDAVSLYGQYSGTDHVSTDIKEILAGAAYGRVATLLVSLEAHQWGTFDPESIAIEVHGNNQAGDQDLLDEAAIQTYINGGKVFPLRQAEMPAPASVAAVFRF